MNKVDNNTVNFNEFIEGLKSKHNINSPDFNLDISRFLVSNNWFGCSPTIESNILLFDDKSIEIISKKVGEYCENYNKSDDEKANYLLNNLDNQLPKTTKLLKKYIKTTQIDEQTSLSLIDFIYTYLPGELDESTDKEVSRLLDDAFDELPHAYGVILSDFVNWTHEHTKTLYKNLYFMNNYSSDSDKNSAYDPHSYLDILYHLYNQDYIDENDMYVDAAESKNYADTWLFLAMHFLCALRNTDLIRIPHPRLPMPPEKVLEQVVDGTFSEASAKSTIYTIIWQLEALMLTPNKTQGTSGVAAIKLHIPESVETHIGTLFAIAEAHFQLSGEGSEKPLIRMINRYEQINRYMGEEIGNLFLESDFRSKAANKSYMQMIYILTDDILGVNDEFRVKGYKLAALARSHKGSYGDFAKTTSIYLKDAKMSGYTPEFVAKELFERGVLSVIPSMLLKMVAGEEYQKLSVESQTEMIKELNMSPMEIENTVAVVQKNMKRSTELVKTLYSSYSKEEVLNILHSIGNGEAVSKTDSCMCLVTAMGKVCPYAGHSNCPSCEYEISTKTTMFLMAREVHRLQEIYKTTDNELEKLRCKAIVKDIIAPSIEEMLSVMADVYGLEAVKMLEQIIMEENNG